MKKRTTPILALFLAGATPAFADEVSLSNGDRVSGAILELDQESLTIESELLGTIAAPWGEVLEARSEGALYLVRDDGTTLVGAVVVDDSAVTVETADSGPIRVARAAILAIRSLSRQEAFVQAQQAAALPPPPQWAASADGALSLSSGNADTRSVSLGLRAARTTIRDRTSFYWTSLFSDNSTSGAIITTANAVRGGGRYELDVSDRAFAFGFSDLEFDRFQDLDLRLVIGGGMGLNLVQSPNASFQVFGGGSSNQEFFSSGIRRRSGESVVGEAWTFRLNGTTSLTERLAVYPNLTDRGQYRVNFDTTAETRMSDLLSWQVTVSDRYVSNPRPGKRGNDLLFTTGIRINLGDGSVGAVGPGNINFR